MIKDFIHRQARVLLLKEALREVRQRQARLNGLQDDVYFNIFNTGLTVNLKKTGGIVLNMIINRLEKEVKKSSKGGKHG